MNHIFIIGGLSQGKPTEKRCKARTLSGAKRACIENYSVKQYDVIYVHEYANGTLARVWTKTYHHDWELQKCQ